MLNETFDKETQQTHTNVSDGITTVNNQSNFLSGIGPSRQNNHNFDNSFFQQSILQSDKMGQLSQLSPSEKIKK